MSRRAAPLMRFIPRQALWADGNGLVHYVVPPRTFVTDEAGRTFARAGDHVHGYRRPRSFVLQVQSALICDYCEAMRRIANGQVVESS